MLIKLSRSPKTMRIVDNIVFFRQLHTLIAAGVPLIEALTLMSSHPMGFPFIANLRQALLNGESFYQAMLSCNFDVWICELIKLGEYTGKLTQVLEAIANHLEQQWQLKKRILSIIFYPSLILLLAVIITLFLLIVVVPQFQIMFKEAKTELPRLTRIIFYCANITINLGLPLLLILPSGIFLLNEQRTKLFAYVKNLPLLKQVLLKIQLATWSHKLALALTAGLPITKALELVDPTDAASRPIYLKLRQQLLSGKALHQAMLNTQYFPLLMVHMIKIGENSGQLEIMLNKIGDIFKNEAEQSLSLFCQILDPLIMVSLGVLIGGLLIGIYLPIFNLGTTL